MTEPETDVIRVALADDQGVIRAGLRMIIDHEPDLRVVAEAGDGVEAVDTVAASRPDVVLMDVRMPRLDGIEATRRILESWHGTSDPPAVLVLTTFDDEEYVLGAVRAGASGFLLKDAGPDTLVAAIRTVHGGSSLVDPGVTRTLIERCLTLEEQASVAPAPASPTATAWAERLDALSDREREILAGLARGLSNRDLARELVVSETTVKSHVSSVLTKLGLHSRVQAVVLAYEAGVVTPGQLAPPT